MKTGLAQDFAPLTILFSKEYKVFCEQGDNEVLVQSLYDDLITYFKLFKYIETFSQTADQEIAHKFLVQHLEEYYTEWSAESYLEHSQERVANLSKIIEMIIE